VSIKRDLGAVVELASGLAPTDQVIENPPDGIGNGARVRRAIAAASGAVPAAPGKHENAKS
jgi:membrane fusion protein, multidrug efflux system